MGSSRSQLGTADYVQGLLDDHRDSMNSESQVKLTAVLSKSYERLPSDAHRLMFVDVALLLRGRPPAHLTALWGGQLLLNECEWPSGQAAASSASRGAVCCLADPPAHCSFWEGSRAPRIPGEASPCSHRNLQRSAWTRKSAVNVLAELLF